MKLFDKTWKLAVSGAVIGLLVMLLAIYGNPANMAICVACFIRDTAGALKLHTAAPVQYFRPEVVGFAAVLAGGCPLRQLILAGQGSSDSAVTFLGMLVGAAFAHNFGLVGAAAKAATETEPAVAGGPAAAGKIAVIVCIIVLFVIAGTNLRRKKTAK